MTLRRQGAPVSCVVLTLMVLARGAPAEQPDVAGSRDPFGVERYPRSWVVEYHDEDEVRPREFVMSRVDKIRRELRVEERLRVDAALETVTYQLPEGAAVADVVTHYLQTLDADVLFRCEGRGCGRSADWANQIFEQSILYGPDRYQRYVALEWRDRLVALYVNQRGNQRVYAHLRFLEPQGDLAMEPNALLARRLAERGWAVIEGVRPGHDASFTDLERQVLGSLGERLSGFAREQIHVVCHLYGGGDTPSLIARSQRCAEAAATLISGAGESQEGSSPQPGTVVEGFGAGPLLPRSQPAQSRLELVLPASFRSSRR